MSSVTLAELEYGLHRKGQPVRLRNALTQVLLRMDVLPWDEDVATCYGVFCGTLEAQGITLSDFDMTSAAHALALDVTLVSRDKAFAQVPPGVNQGLKLEVWSPTLLQSPERLCKKFWWSRSSALLSAAESVY